MVSAREFNLVPVKICFATHHIIQFLPTIAEFSFTNGFYFLVGAHIELQAASEDDLTEEVVQKKLAASGGAHQPTGYEFN